MLEILKILQGYCRIGIRHDPVKGYSAEAEGLVGVLALVLICLFLAWLFKQ